MWCHGFCQVLVDIKGDELIRVKDNKTPPYNVISKACPRARAARELFYHPERLHYPLKRDGERGENKWQTLTWEQALDEVAGKMKRIMGQYGPEAIATSSGTGRTHDEYRERFFDLLGSPNHIGQRNICAGPRLVMNCAMFGWAVFPMIREETKCIMIWGGGTPWYMPQLWTAARKAIKRGAKLIVIDPRRVRTAAKADIWLRPRPGTDCALAMGMLNVIINEAIYDKEFVENWCHGFDKLAKRVQEYPPEKVAGITGVPAEEIKQAARMYATSGTAASTHGMGVEQLPNSIEALHALYSLTAITGNINVKGGDIISGPHSKMRSLPSMLSEKQKKKQIGADRFRLMAWPGRELMEPHLKRVWGQNADFAPIAHAPTVYRAMITGEPYPVKAMITLSSNPMVTQANTKLVYKALKNLDLYVVVDHWLTPSAQRADYVFPAATWLERPHVWNAFGAAKFIFAHETIIPGKIEGKCDHRPDYEFWRGLGIRLGQDWPWETLEDAYDYRLAPLGYTLREFIAEKNGFEHPRIELRHYETTGFGTPTGKIELYSTILEKLGYDPLPSYKEPALGPVSNPDLAEQFPLFLITGGRFNPMHHSEHRQIKSFRKTRPNPLTQIHPDTAAELEIEDGDWVWIETPIGRTRQQCKYFEGIDPKIVHAEHGWWFPELPGEEPGLHGVWESNINVCTDDNPDLCNQLNGAWPLRTMLCRVYKAEPLFGQSATEFGMTKGLSKNTNR